MSRQKPKKSEPIQHRIERRQRRMKFVRYGIFLPSILVGALTGIGAMIWPSVNTVETGQTREYQDLQPQFFDASIPALSTSVKNTVSAHSRLTFHVDNYPNNDDTRAQFNIVAKGPVIPTTTNIRITMHKSGSGRSAVNMRADSASGTKTDFGQRARNIRFLQEEIDARLPRHEGLLDDGASE